MPSIYDVIISQKYWTFNGALIRPDGETAFDRAYPGIGLRCEAFTTPDQTDGDGITLVGAKEFHSWTGASGTSGVVNHHTSAPHVRKALRLRMHEPQTYQHQVRANHPDKFPPQAEMCPSLKKGIEEKLLFIEHGDYLISNPLLVKDPLIKGGEQLSVVYVIRLVGQPGKWGMVITGYWSDGYLGTGGWC